MTMDTSEKREPLMTDAEACSLRSDIDSVALRVRDFYEAKIASGELRVVLRVKLYEEGIGWTCPNCKFFFNGHVPPPGDFCRCGAQIIE